MNLLIYPPPTSGNDLVAFYRRMGRPQGRSGRVQKISLPLRFDLRTVQPVASRYTDYALPGKINYSLTDIYYYIVYYVYFITGYMLCYFTIYSGDFTFRMIKVKILTHTGQF